MKPKLLLFLFAAILFAGELTGSILRVIYPVRCVWQEPFVLHGIGRLGASVSGLLSELLVFPILWLGAFCVLGLAVCAVPGVLLLVFLHGMTLGSVLACAYQGHLLTGLCKVLCFVMPYALVQTAVFLLAARSAVKSSNALTRTLIGCSGGRVSLRRYAMQSLVLGIALAAAGLAQSFWGGGVYPFVLRWFVRE